MSRTYTSFARYNFDQYPFEFGYSWESMAKFFHFDNVLFKSIIQSWYNFAYLGRHSFKVFSSFASQILIMFLNLCASLHQVYLADSFINYLKKWNITTWLFFLNLYIFYCFFVAFSRCNLCKKSKTRSLFLVEPKKFKICNDCKV